MRWGVVGDRHPEAAPVSTGRTRAYTTHNNDHPIVLGKFPAQERLATQGNCFCVSYSGLFNSLLTGGADDDVGAAGRDVQRSNHPAKFDPRGVTAVGFLDREGESTLDVAAERFDRQQEIR